MKIMIHCEPNETVSNLGMADAIVIACKAIPELSVEKIARMILCEVATVKGGE